MQGLRNLSLGADGKEQTLRFNESIQLIGSVDFDMGDKGQRITQVEVLIDLVIR